jgi:hypothetical protein
VDEQENMSVCDRFISEHDIVPSFPKIQVTEGDEGAGNLSWEVVWALKICYAPIRRQGRS